MRMLWVSELGLSVCYLVEKRKQTIKISFEKAIPGGQEIINIIKR